MVTPVYVKSAKIQNAQRKTKDKQPLQAVGNYEERTIIRLKGFHFHLLILPDHNQTLTSIIFNFFHRADFNLLYECKWSLNPGPGGILKCRTGPLKIGFY
jgi:hypothetical protein